MGLLVAAEGRVRVSFVSPPPNLPVSGRTRVAVTAQAPPGSVVVRIEIYIDGSRIASLEHPPYEIEWDAGEKFRSHLIRAVAFTDSDEQGSAVLRTPELRVGQRESVHLVNLYVTVLDGKNRPVADLKAENFAVFEDGIKQSITHFSSSRQPLSVALLIDASNSMGRGRRLEIAQKAAIDFIDKSEKQDQLMVISFSDAVRPLQGPTTDRKALEKAIKGIRPGGGTALYDALMEATLRLEPFEGRKVVVLLSDGRDQSFKENAPGSLHLFEESVDSAVRREVAVYAVGLGAHLEMETDLNQRRSLKSILETFATRTGGRFYNPQRPGQLSDVYDQISDDLSRQYTLAYSPENQSWDGHWREIRVEVDRPGLEVLTRPGYYAPHR